MVAARRRSASSGPLRGLKRHVRRRARSGVQSNLPAMPTIGEGGLIPPISGQSQELLAHPSAWFRALLSLRDGIVAPFGIKTSGSLHKNAAREKIYFFPVVRRTPTEVVVGEVD